MNLSRCQKGHFYDADKYMSCPHCESAGVNTALTAAFAEDLTVPNYPNDDEMPRGNYDVISVTPQMPPTPSAFPVANMPANSLTVDYEGAGDTPTERLNPEIAQDSETDETIGIYDVNIFSTPSTEKVKNTTEKPVNKVGNPCVGWLIALGGNHFGTDFRLKAGKNYIGRSEKMDIALTKDTSVSREKHAILVYEPKEHLYIIQPGEASTLVYKNEAVVLEPTRLEAYDVINVGSVNLLFIPLCNKEFNWTTLIEEKRSNNEL